MLRIEKFPRRPGPNFKYTNLRIALPTASRVLFNAERVLFRAGLSFRAVRRRVPSFDSEVVLHLRIRDLSRHRYF